MLQSGMDKKDVTWEQVEEYAKRCIADALTALKYPGLAHETSQLYRGQILALEKLLELPNEEADAEKSVSPAVVFPGY